MCAYKEIATLFVSFRERSWFLNNSFFNIRVIDLVELFCLIIRVELEISNQIYYEASSDKQLNGPRSILSPTSCF